MMGKAMYRNINKATFALVRKSPLITLAYMKKIVRISNKNADIIGKCKQ